MMHVLRVITMEQTYVLLVIYNNLGHILSYNNLEIIPGHL